MTGLAFLISFTNFQFRKFFLKSSLLRWRAMIANDGLQRNRVHTLPNVDTALQREPQALVAHDGHPARRNFAER